MWDRKHLLNLMIFAIVILNTMAASDGPHWTKYNRVTKAVPDDAIIGGHENGELYIIRAPHEGSVAPGKFYLSTHKAFIPWRYKSHPKTDFEILCGNGLNYKWVPTKGNNIPIRAVVGGRSEQEHEPLYICRVHFGGHIIPGKVHPSHSVCYVAYGNKEIHSNTYEILVEADRVVPKISGKPRDTVAMGKTIDIQCKVIKSNPEPKISWQFKAKGSTEFKSIAGSNKVLRLPNVDAKDAGVYKCIATNALGSDVHLTELTVEFGSSITSSPSTEFNSVLGDLNVTIPCDAVGVPQPKITWKVNGVDIKQGTHYSVTNNGALVIRYPEEVDSNFYTCVATNKLGSAATTFKVTVHPFDYGTVDEVNIKQGTTKILDCGPVGPTQSVRWYVEGLETNIEERFYRLENVDDTSADGNYTCRVSNKDGTYDARTYQVNVVSLQFSSDQKETLFDWSGSDLEELNCDVDAKPTPDIKWSFNGKELKNQKSTRLTVKKWGLYTCTATNIHGSIQRSFTVTSSNCLIPRNPPYIQTMPLLLTPTSTWPALNSNTDYVIVEHGQTVTFACPINKKTTNFFVEFPYRNEITASCDQQDNFKIDDVSYKISNFRCAEEIETEIIRHKRNKCLTETSELMIVGYDVADFLEGYEVCFDESKNMPLYSRVLMSKSNRGGGHTYSWHKYPGLGSASGYTVHSCTHSTSSCCYTKTQLVNARDVSDGAPQKSTFIDPLNAVPLWLPCVPHRQSPWASIEDTVRSQLNSYDQFVVWSGTHKLQNIKGSIIPRYLWKVVRFAADNTLAIVYVNGPSPSAADILCRNICANNKIVPWIHEHDNHTYCCQVDEFLSAFGLRATTVGKPMQGALDEITPKQDSIIVSPNGVHYNIKG